MKFKKGQSGNPSGRPKEVAEVKELARSHLAAAIQTLASIMSDTKEDARARVAAANALLDRGYGKPSQEVKATLDGFPVPAPVVLIQTAMPSLPDDQQPR